MIKSNEIRIGNLLHDGSGRLCRVEEISKNSFKAPAIVGGLTTVDPTHSYIEITKEWLLKFGFYEVAAWMFVNGDYRAEFMLQDRVVTIRVKTGNNTSTAIADIIFVHQLQNLYFALTGEELKLK